MYKDSYTFNMICFTTNNDRFSPKTIIKKYIENSGYDNMKIIKDNSLNFYYKLENEQYKLNKLLISVHEILNFENGKYDICCFADSYLIIIDLEKDDTYDNLDIIINFMKNVCDLEKNIFVLGVYVDAKNTKKELDEENIIEYLDDKKLIYEYVESNIDSIKDLIKTIDFIIKEGIKKIEKKLMEKGNNSTIDSQCESKCFLF